MSLRSALFFSTLVLCLLGATIGLSDQEAYYWTWAQRPAFCYFEHPPLHAWIMGALTSLFGHSAMVVRLPAILGRLASLGLFYYWAKTRSGSRVAELGLWILLPSVFMVGGGVLSLPDSIFLPLGLLTVLYAERGSALKTGIFLGLAALAKWMAALLIPGVLYCFLLAAGISFSERIKRITLVGILALGLQAPVLLWNYEHDWASFLFHLRDRHETAALGFNHVFANLFNFLASQLMLGGLGFVVAAAFVLRLGLRKRPTKSKIAWPPLQIWIWPFFLVFGLSALRGELRFYWTAFAFFPLALTMAHRLAKAPLKLQLVKLQHWQSSVLALTLFFVFAVLSFPVGVWVRPLTDLYKSYDLRHSPRGDLDGWTQWVNQELEPRGLLANKNIAFYASDFRLAAQAAWALGPERMNAIGTARRAQFQWKFWPKPSPDEFSEAIFFGDNRHRIDDYFDGFCADAPSWNSFEYKLRNETVKRITWSHCKHFEWPRYFRKAERKANST